MPRCDYDTIFHRVSCVTLVGVAITFTIILTDVFVDIDGLLSRKEKGKTIEMPEPVFENEQTHMKSKPSPNLIRKEYYKEEKNYDDDDTYRSKRSLETPNFLFHVKNPKIKSILTDRLATLLEQLDEEESTPNENKRDEIKIEDKLEMNNRRNAKSEEKDDLDDRKKIEKLIEAMKAKTNNEKIEDKKPVIKQNERKEDDMLHLAMHNILLQGIIGHMDLNDVFKKVHMLVRSFRDGEESPKVITTAKPEPMDLQRELKKIIKGQRGPTFEENKFFEELTKCEKLQNEITGTKTETVADAKDEKQTTLKGPKLLIKTIIDITSNKDKNNKDSLTNSKETIKGIIKLMYNGKSVKFSRMEDEDRTPVKKISTEKPISFSDTISSDITEKPNNVEMIEPTSESPKAERFLSKKSYFNQIIENYLQKYPKNLNDLISGSDIGKNFETKRLKRQIKIRYEDDDPNSTTLKPKGLDDDDELYVEIETHFDSKGMKGMKKKKLIRSIIDKIQKAIHSDSDMTKFTDGKKKKHKHLQVKKRYQNPLDKSHSHILNKIVIPLDEVVQRHSDPILRKDSILNKFTEKSIDSWRREYYGPNFLTPSKSVNSAERGEIDIDYNKVMAVNGIPQRLQKPLNTENSEELLNAKTYFNLGDLKFFVKNIDGTGLSIGFNQYTDEPPDPETIKLFTGIENLIQTYNKNNEDDVLQTHRLPPKASDEIIHELSKRETKKEHVIIRRSVKETHENDYHSNEYKIIYDNNFLPYDNYQEIYEDKKKGVAFSLIPSDLNAVTTTDRTSNVNLKSLPTIVEDNIFNKKLKPSEILSLAALLDRKKRSVSRFHKIKNIKTKVKLNRYINTRTMGSKKLFINKKRNKRQIDKIRIIATDGMAKHHHSDENIFVVDDENILADRAIIRELDSPDPYPVENVEEKLPQEHYRVLPSYIYDEPVMKTNDFDTRRKHNVLMSKYPHIFLEEVEKSREEIEPIYFNQFEPKPKMLENERIQVTGNNITTVEELPPSLPKLDELVNAIEPKQNYKFTVKIIPKNISDLNSGFKEIHTSINKSFNKDGLIYSSLVNVSEISKVEKLQKTKNEVTFTSSTPMESETNIVKQIQEQQNKMDMLLQQHKQRIDEQLEHLKKERFSLDSLSHKPLEHIKSTKKQLEFNHNTDALSHMKKEDISKLIALLKLESQQKTSTQPPTTTSTTPQPTTTIEPIKMKLLSKIQKNENVTNQILHQINRNTQMLQAFLQKLADKLTNVKESRRHDSEEINSKYEFMRRFWKPYQHPPGIYPTDASVDPHKNNSVGIPFVYAYQPAYPTHINFKPNVPLASVVYHGHIHTDALKPKVETKSDHPNVNQREANVNDEHNQTRYFIDALENDFKTLPVKGGNNIQLKNVQMPLMITTPRHTNSI